MREVIICMSIIIALISAILAYISFKKYKEINKNYKLLKEDNYNFVSRSLMECELITNLCKEMVQVLDELKISSF